MTPKKLQRLEAIGKWLTLSWLILRSRARLPVFTVGTGLYLRALLEGLADIPQRSEELRERLRHSAQEHAAGHLHRILSRLDGDAARKISAADEQKLIRAIEVCLIAKKPLTELHQSGRVPLEGWRVLKIGLAPERDALYARIHARTETMLANAWLEEVRSLLDAGLPENAKPFDFIGYRELRAVLQGRLRMDEARAAIQQATRRYAKRQLTSGFAANPQCTGSLDSATIHSCRNRRCNGCANGASFRVAARGRGVYNWRLGPHPSGTMSAFARVARPAL